MDKGLRGLVLRFQQTIQTSAERGSIGKLSKLRIANINFHPNFITERKMVEFVIVVFIAVLTFIVWLGSKIKEAGRRK